MTVARTSASVDVPRQPTAAGARPVARTAAAVRLTAPGPAAVLREIVLVTALLLAYQGGRLLGGHDRLTADANGLRVLQLEQVLRLPREQDLQALVLPLEPVVQAANGFYAAAHLPVTALALLWLLVRRPAVYRWARTALGAATGTALVVYVLVPVTPPRLLDGHGFVDTAELHGQSVYDASSSLTNQFAALPSLHVGWAVLVAVVCVSASATRWAWLWVLHPVATVAVVVATGNHYWLDAAAGAALVGIALVAARHRPLGTGPLRTGRRPAP
ncbi:MAG: hypothetical protein JWN08_825 [Frankiales bacterium]|nr:hypothetical protein [Frankiales bacterium]